MKEKEGKKGRILILLGAAILIFILSILVYYYFFYNPYLQDMRQEIDYDSLERSTDFNNSLTKNYTNFPSSVVDMGYSQEMDKLFSVDTNANRIMVFHDNLSNVENMGEMYGEGGDAIVSGRSDEITGDHEAEDDRMEGDEVEEEIEKNEQFFSYPTSIGFMDDKIVVLDAVDEKLKYFNSDFKLVKSVKLLERVSEEAYITAKPDSYGSELDLEIFDDGTHLISSVKENSIVSFNETNFFNSIEVEGNFNIETSGNIFYLVNNIDNKIIKYNSDLEKMGSFGNFENPFDLCLNNDKLIVTDKKKGIMIFDDEELEETKKINYKGNEISPSFITCNEDNLFIYDDVSSTLLKVSSSNFSILDHKKSSEDLSFTFSAPTYTSISPKNEDIAITDPKNSLILIMNSDFELKRIIGPGYGDSENKFRMPSGVEYDSDGNLYVGDRWNRKIKKYDSDYNLIDTISKTGEYSMDVGDLIILDNGNIIYTDLNTGNAYVVTSENEIVKEIEFEEEGLGLAKQDGNYYFLENREEEYYMEDGERVEIEDDEEDDEEDDFFLEPEEDNELVISKYDSNYNFEEEYVVYSDKISSIPSVEDDFFSQSLIVYDNIAVFAYNKEGLLIFYDMEKEEIVKELELTPDNKETSIWVGHSPDKSYILATNQEEEKVFRISKEDKKIEDMFLVSDFY
ncbi:MAG: hypothetical protein ACOCRX_02930 [Candidatus Woesearchaeota archaeon]